jgi:pimeloyl-ACP methyl ester carboxylesterase
MATDAEFYFSKQLLDHFDVVAFDPRGTGASQPFVDCIDEIDAYFAADITYDSPEDRQRLIDDAQALHLHERKRPRHRHAASRSRVRQDLVLRLLLRQRTRRRMGEVLP